MDEHDWLAERFEEQRGHLRAVAYRMLGSLSEADDAVQEAWLRLSRADTSNVENLGGWLTTVVGRVCLDMLRSRTSRREEPLDAQVPEPEPECVQDGSDPEHEALLADSVGLALLVVLETLAPAERLAFVLHDMFAVPFDEIAPIVGRSPDAARQLASRARRRVHGVVGERDGPGAGRRSQPSARRRRRLPRRRARWRLRGAAGGARPRRRAANRPRGRGALACRRRSAAPRTVAARAVRGGARAAQPALVNGAVGVIVAPRGRLLMVLDFTIEDGKIVAIDAIADPERLRQLDLAMLTD